MPSIVNNVLTCVVFQNGSDSESDSSSISGNEENGNEGDIETNQVGPAINARSFIKFQNLGSLTPSVLTATFFIC